MSNAYVQQSWADGPAGNTPVTAATLTHVEDGLESAHDRIDALTVGTTLTPVAVRTSTLPPGAGQLVTYDASAGNIGPIPLPVPAAGVLMGIVKGDSSTNTVTFTSSTLLGNGGSTSIVLRTLGESRTLYGSASGWFVAGLRAPTIGTAAGTVAAGDDARFANTLTAALYGGASRTRAPMCEATFTGSSFAIGASDVYAAGSWTATVDTDAMLAPVGGFSAITVPVAGRYEYYYHLNGVVSAGAVMNARITRNSANFANSIALDVRRFSANDVATLHAGGNRVLAAGDVLYWAAYSSAGVFTVYPQGGVYAPTQMVVRYIGPL